MKVVHEEIPEPEVMQWIIGFVAHHNKTIKDKKRRQRRALIKTARIVLTD